MTTAPGVRLPADQRRRQLLEVSRDAFAQHGFHATSMDEIAEQAGVTKPVLYQHFPSKRSLYVELLQDTGEQMLAALGNATTTATSGRARLEAALESYFRFAVEQRAAFRLLFSTSIRNDPEFASVVESVVRQASEMTAMFIEIPASEEHRRVLGNAIVGMAEAVGRRAVTDDAAVDDAVQLARWISELAWFGLRGIRAEDRTDV
ncbi:MAG: helix-turn-helix domain-containing protein [Actinomycetota bacterium]|nr:helix-turn-helix domain-containing protein [Actinomycetota bacterium]